VLVAAPISARKTGVDNFLHKKADWIIEKLKKQDNNLTIISPKKFENGESLYFLGTQYNLKIVKDIISAIELEGLNMLVYTPYTSPTKVKALLKKWYKQQTEQVFKARLKECLKLSEAIGIKYANDIAFRRMKDRWGTCTHDNKIILNSSLIYLDVEFIDYVILHELCHFKEKNHSPRYYALLTSLCPNYKNIRKRLNQHDIESWN
jgi:predicted metal-dependent hydrolase